MKHNINNIIDINDLESSEILKILKLMKILKKADYDGALPQLLKNKTLMMLFQQPSTRTRISFGNAMTKLGGEAIYAKENELHLNKKESLYDTIKVISRLADGILGRLTDHPTILSIEKYADVPVINALTPYNHPTQGLCDVFTMWESTDKNLEDCHVVFVGDSDAVCRSLLHTTSKLNMRFTHIAPEKYWLKKSEISKCINNLKPNSKNKINLSSDVNDVADADFIYTDLWWWTHQVDEAPERYKKFMKGGFQVNSKLMNLNNNKAKVMHCLPGSRNVEITDEIFDGPNSIIYNQSENKLYSAMAVLLYLIYPNSLPLDLKKSKTYEEELKKILNLKYQKMHYKKFTYNNDYSDTLDYLKDLKKTNKKKK